MVLRTQVPLLPFFCQNSIRLPANAVPMRTLTVTYEPFFTTSVPYVWYGEVSRVL